MIKAVAVFQGKIKGNVIFTETDKGTKINVNISNLPKGETRFSYS